MNSIKVGDIITIKKGSLVKSYNPAKPEYTLTRSQKVKIHHQYQAYKYINYHHEEVSANAKIVWAGTGSYWYWTDISNIIIE